jgi:RNase P/RNase MRP subunit p29
VLPVTVASDVIEWFESYKNCHRNSIARSRLKGLVIVVVEREEAAQLGVKGLVTDF